ncbi:MAG: carboxypeptidase M32 [Pseudomonadota bacterium]
MSLENLLDHAKQTSALSQVAGLISWDQETMMPKKGNASRAEQSGAIAAVIHGRNADPRIADWMEGVDRTTLSEFDQRNVAEIERSHRRATRVPERLARELAVAASAGQTTWVEARADKDFSKFKPALKRNIDLKKEAAACLIEDGQSAYDVLLDEFEPGARTQELSDLLESLRPALVSLRQRISEKPAPKRFIGAFGKAAQLALAEKIAAAMGYDFDAGRLDLAAHPFSSGSVNDARITTRVDEKDPLNCLYSTIHEVGHALYTQGGTDEFLPAADYCSMGVHESQSRFWENQIGRSRQFADWLYPELKSAFGEFGLNSPDDVYTAVNRVETDFIRTEADEVHYNLHILLRFSLERDLISGALAVDDLEEAWNTQFKADFGLDVPDPSLGVLQDVHWSAGLFGYFPTYSLGNIYSACLDQAMREDIPDRDTLIEKADCASTLQWMRDKIHSKGRVLQAPELIERATGKPPSAQPLIDYLERKFSGLYNL